MTEIQLMPDPVARALRFLTLYYPAGSLGIERPRESFEELLIVVSDTGGAGQVDHAFDEVRLTVEVFDRDAETASRVAREVAGLFRVWPWEEAGVYAHRVISRPYWDPDPDLDSLPCYTQTHEFRFRGQPTTITPHEE